MNKILQNLPKANFQTLKRVINHFEQIVKFEADNKMTAFNLATVFGPTLMWPSPDEDTTLQSLTNDVHYQNEVILFCMEKYSMIFEVEEKNSIYTYDSPPVKQEETNTSVSIKERGNAFGISPIDGAVSRNQFSSMSQKTTSGSSGGGAISSGSSRAKSFNSSNLYPSLSIKRNDI